MAEVNAVNFPSHLAKSHIHLRNIKIPPQSSLTLEKKKNYHLLTIIIAKLDVLQELSL